MTQYCGATAKSTGKPCKRPAGWGTDHVGFGRCKLHGGATPIKHGRYSLAHRQALEAKAEKYMQDPRPGDLSAELALMRALLQDFLDRYPDGISLPLDHIAAIYEMTEKISRMVERISKILSQTALTQAELQMFQAKLAELLIKYIDEPDDRTRLLDELSFTIRSNAGRNERVGIRRSAN